MQCNKNLAVENARLNILAPKCKSENAGLGNTAQ